MNSIHRELNIKEGLKNRSFFLFGPRQTGKTWFIKNELSNCRVFNLLDSKTYLRLSREPYRLREEILPEDQIVVIDEIQKIPSLLDEIHLLIEERSIKFLLTGSSARKLRSQGTNLLGGRARMKVIHPFIRRELGEAFNLIKALDTGLLPSIYFSPEPAADLEAYTGVYLQEEISAEALVRNIPSFSRFLTVAALYQGQIINFSNIASDAQVSRTTIHNYFQILQDTLIIKELPAWRKTIKRKASTTAKFYFFDTGVARILQRRKSLAPGTSEFGEAFEGYLFHELTSWIDYHGGGELAFWRSVSGYEVDFILDNAVAIEVKAKKIVANHDLKGLRALREETAFSHYIVVSLEEVERFVDGIQILPWEIFLDRLWQGEYGKDGADKS